MEGDGERNLTELRRQPEDIALQVFLLEVHLGVLRNEFPELGYVDYNLEAGLCEDQVFRDQSRREADRQRLEFLLRLKEPAHRGC